MKVAGEYHVRLVKLARGWRYWAFHIITAGDVEHGLSADGYATEAEAIQAAEKAGLPVRAMGNG